MQEIVPWLELNRHTITQTGLMSSLLDGVYDGETTIRDLLGHGNFGLGTFNGLDGEMVIIDGKCYQMKSDGTTNVPSYSEKTPFAVVTNFVPHLRQSLPWDKTRSEISEVIDQMTYSPNYMYALKITGNFHWITTRTVSKQNKPYRPMIEAVSEDGLHEFKDISGILVGFRTPIFEQGISVPGCHVHFLADDLSHGGHVIDFKVKDAVAELCLGTDLNLALPLTKIFREANLDKVDYSQVGSVERSNG